MQENIRKLSPDEKRFLAYAREGNLDYLALMLASGVDISVTDEEGHNALTSAILYCKNESKRHATVDYLINELYKRGIPIDDFRERQYGCTPLMLAAEIGDKELSYLLLSAGSKINARDYNGCTPFHRIGSSEIVDIFLEAGGDVNEKANDGETPLMRAVHDVKILKKLISIGADVHVKDHQGFTTLHYAASNGNLGTIQLLLQAGAKVNAKTREGISPLMLASLCGWLEAVKRLCESGAKINTRDKMGNTALMMAAGRNLCEIVSFLLDADARVSFRNENGDDAMILAIRGGKGNRKLPKIVEILLDRGAVDFIRNKNGKSAYKLAKEGGLATFTTFAMLHERRETNMREAQKVCDLIAQSKGPGFVK